MEIKISSGPKMTLEITDREREVAKKVKKEFKTISRELDDAVKVVLDLRDAITNQRPTKDDLNKAYRGRLLRYKKKIRDAFNHFLTHTKRTLETAVEISDPDMVRLREILVAEIGELSDGVEALMDLLSETDRDNFTQTLEQISSQLEKRQKSIEDVIENQLFNHIETDILGRMKISEIQNRLRRRTRILRQLVEK